MVKMSIFYSFINSLSTKKKGFAKEQNDVIFITASLTLSFQRFFNTHVSGASEVNTMLSLDCIDFVSSSVDSHVSILKTQVSILKPYPIFFRVGHNENNFNPSISSLVKMLMYILYLLLKIL